VTPRCGRDGAPGRAGGPGRSRGGRAGGGRARGHRGRARSTLARRRPGSGPGQGVERRRSSPVRPRWSPTTIRPRSVASSRPARSATASSGSRRGARPTATHGRRSVRPSSGEMNGSARVRPSSLAGTVGSRKGRLSCTGPAGAPRPMVAPTARATDDRQCGTASGRSSATPSSWNHRRLRPNRWSWSIAWFAPVSRSSGGRSAVSSSSGTAPASASTTAGWRFATAEPEVTRTAAGRPVTRPSPTARNPADRSSTSTWRRRRGSSWSVIASAADRDPGARTASVTPQRASSSTSTSARAWDGFCARTRAPQSARWAEAAARRSSSPTAVSGSGVA
jgi:hypothetical protein